MKKKNLPQKAESTPWKRYKINDIQIIDDENIEKMKFMEELKTMTDEYIILSQGQKKLE